VQLLQIHFRETLCNPPLGKLQIHFRETLLSRETLQIHSGKLCSRGTQGTGGRAKLQIHFRETLQIIAKEGSTQGALV